jgi:lambda family phage portal protein
MAFGDFLDGVIEPFAPAAAARRRSARIGLTAIRQYEAAKNDRKTQGWNRPASSANRETAQGLIGLRNGARDLVRNNKYASAALRQMTAQMIGDGITARCVHSDPVIAATAQQEWDSWSNSPVYEGRHNFFHVQKLIGRGMIEGGEMLQVWLPLNGVPDSRIRVLEGDYLDSTKTYRTAQGRVVQGVEFDAEGNRSAYHLFAEHPGDVIFGGGLNSVPVAAEYVDHVFEEIRAPQARGVSWLGAVALTLRDVSDIEDATRLKKKVEACLALVLTRESADGSSPILGEQKDQGPNKQDIETMRPGMIWRARPGEDAKAVTPAASHDTVEFLRQQIAAVSASLIPYHLMTGDVSQANYSGLRAAMLGFWTLLDDWQQQIVIPLCCQSAFNRRMRVLATRTGDPRYLQVLSQWAVPKRGLVDPVKDLMGEILEIRAGLTHETDALARRGIDIDKHFAEIARINALIDKLGLALDTDPRRLTTNGILQIAAGYLAPKGDGAAT